ncbi:hypothetical protein H8959_008121 [Pygathrix nigripes]
MSRYLGQGLAYQHGTGRHFLNQGLDLDVRVNKAPSLLRGEQRRGPCSQTRGVRRGPGGRGGGGGGWAPRSRESGQLLRGAAGPSAWSLGRGKRPAAASVTAAAAPDVAAVIRPRQHPHPRRPQPQHRRTESGVRSPDPAAPGEPRLGAQGICSAASRAVSPPPAIATSRASSPPSVLPNPRVALTQADSSQPAARWDVPVRPWPRHPGVRGEPGTFPEVRYLLRGPAPRTWLPGDARRLRPGSARVQLARGRCTVSRDNLPARPTRAGRSWVLRGPSVGLDTTSLEPDPGVFSAGRRAGLPRGRRVFPG